MIKLKGFKDGIIASMEKRINTIDKTIVTTTTQIYINGNSIIKDSVNYGNGMIDTSYTVLTSFNGILHHSNTTKEDYKITIKRLLK